jgi:hypothetical protein
LTIRMGTQIQLMAHRRLNSGMAGGVRVAVTFQAS